MSFHTRKCRAGIVRAVWPVRLALGLLILGAAALALPAPPPASAAANVAVLRPYIADILAEGFTDVLGEEDGETLRILRRIYSEHQMRPFWMTADGPSPQGRVLLDALQALEEDGLNPSDYGVTDSDPLLSLEPVQVLAELDVRLSLGLIEAASDLANGRVEPARVDPEVFIKPRRLDQEGVLRAALEAADLKAYILGFRPSHENYRRLRAALMRYRRIADEGGWPTIPEFRYELGSKSNNVAILRERLRITGDIPDHAQPSAEPDLFDEVLLRGLERFQKRHGLVPTGRTDYPTLEALNVPVEHRIQQIVINLERHRWLPNRYEERYVFVNLADYELRVVNRGRTIFRTEVVVGAPYHRTPVFSDRIQYLVFNPYWNVPQSIAREEFLPELRENPYYLEEEGYELLSGWSRDARTIDPLNVDWHQIDPEKFPFRLRQKPGPKNSLGNIKFMLPNKHDIYLHDTPKQELFSHNARAFSHGCIRVKDSIALAQILLRGKDGWDRERIRQEIRGNTPHEVRLDGAVPVHLYYLTTWADPDGTVHFREDIYQRDHLLARALFGPRNLLTQVHRQPMPPRPPEDALDMIDAAPEEMPETPEQMLETREEEPGTPEETPDALEVSGPAGMRWPEAGAQR
ncbi:MAG: murein L,D-transpeptidase [Alphaproteobacteria bacterium]